MTTLENIKNNISIFTTFKGAGHYEISVSSNLDNIGSYLETDMEHIDDIDDMNSDGFESNLINSESFEEVFETTLNRLRRNSDISDEAIETIDGLLDLYF